MKKFLTGSLEKDKKDISESLEKESLDLFKKLFETDMFDQLIEEEITREFYTLKSPEKGFTQHWFFNFETKKLESFHKDTIVEIISEYDKENYICARHGSTFVVPKKIIKALVEN